MMHRMIYPLIAVCAGVLLTPCEGANPGKELHKNGGWCWYQGPRAIVLKGGEIVFTTISGDTFGGNDAGDLWVTSYNPQSGEMKKFELHDKFHRDDHDVAGLLELPDGRILAVYGKHNNDKFQRWRTTVRPGDITEWTAEQTFNVGDRYTYSNVFRLADEGGRIYNFSRSRGFNPNCTISEDDGKTWKYGWRLFGWNKTSLKDDPKYTGIDGGRPYLRYTSNNKDTIHFITTEDHPRAYDNSIYHGYYKAGKLHGSDGEVICDPGFSGSSELKPTSFTQVFEGGQDKVAWTTDLEVGKNGNLYAAFSVQMDGAPTRGKRITATGLDHRYWYALFDEEKWHTHEIAYAGTKLYDNESDYTGLIAIDPDEPNVVVISTNADPVSGEPLISKADGKRHWEIFRGRTKNLGETWKWTALTKDSTVDNLRPLIPSNPDGQRHILWCRGDLKTFTDYRLDVWIVSEDR